MGKTNVFLTLSQKGFDKDGEAGSKFGTTVKHGPVNNDGDATSGNSLGSIEVLDYSFSIKQVGSEEGGRPRSVERVEHSQVRIKKFVDNRSPLLFEYCVKGEYISEAELLIFGTNPSEPYLKYTMSYVHVASYEPSGGSDLPVESIGLTYGQMKVQWLDGDNITRAWSWVMEVPDEIAH